MINSLFKAVKRGMDVTNLFLSRNNVRAPDAFILSGISKRGWTAWLTTAIVSERVLGAAPIVFDLINMNKCLHEQFKSLGGHSFAYADYWLVGKLFDHLDTAELDDLASVIDPYGK